MPDEFISCTHGKHNVIQRNNGIMPIPHKIRLKSPRCSLSSAKITQTEHNQACLKLLRCSLSSAKITQTERNQACLKLLRCSLSSAKITQTERNQACLKLLRCSLSSAKISKIKDNMKQRTYFYVHRTNKKKSHVLTTSDFQKTNYLKTNLLKQIKKISTLGFTSITYLPIDAQM